jgi:hypothetical protein
MQCKCFQLFAEFGSGHDDELAPNQRNEEEDGDDEKEDDDDDDEQTAAKI